MPHKENTINYSPGYQEAKNLKAFRVQIGKKELEIQ